MLSLRLLAVSAVTSLCFGEALAQKPPVFSAPPAAQRVAPSVIRPASRAVEDRAIHPPGAGSAQRRVFDLTNTPAATTISNAARARLRNPALCDAVPLEVAPQGGFRTLEAMQFPCLPWRETVAWVESDGARTRYDQWPVARKQRLETFYRAILTNAPDLGVDCPGSPVIAANLSDRQAEDIYLVHVAHALALEHQRALPWRLWRLPVSEREAILAPEHHVMRVRTTTGLHSGYYPPTQATTVRALDCDPRVGLRFLQANGLMGATEEETVRRITIWFRDEVGHGGYSYDELADHAHLADRLTRYQSYSPPPLVAYWAVMGCHSAAVTFADLARSANIPVIPVMSGLAPGVVTGHAGLLFRWARGDTRVLQHADDIYALQSVTFPLGPDGAAATRAEADRQYFDAHWVAPDVLRSHGFDFALTLLANTTTPGEESYGWSIGGWQAGLGRPTPESRASERLSQFSLHKAYDLVSAEMVRAYCQFGLGNLDTNWTIWVEQRSGRPALRTLAPGMVAQRVDAAVAAYGGCAAALDRIQRADAYKARPLGQ